MSGSLFRSMFASWRVATRRSHEMTSGSDMKIDAMQSEIYQTYKRLMLRRLLAMVTRLRYKMMALSRGLDRSQTHCRTSQTLQLSVSTVWQSNYRRWTEMTTQDTLLGSLLDKLETQVLRPSMDQTWT